MVKNDITNYKDNQLNVANINENAVDQLEQIKKYSQYNLDKIEHEVGKKVGSRSKDLLNYFTSHKVAAVKSRQGTQEWRLQKSIKPVIKIIEFKKQPKVFNRTKIEFEEVIDRENGTIRVHKMDGKKTIQQRSMKLLNSTNNMTEKLNTYVEKFNLVRQN